MRRERRGGGADAEAPQDFKEGASTLRDAQNRIHISCSAAAWEVRVGNVQCWGRKKKEVTSVIGSSHILIISISAFEWKSLLLFSPPVVVTFQLEQDW